MSALQQAAGVLLARPGGEVYLVHRSPNLRFMPGFVAFPGGKVGDEDCAAPLPPAQWCAIRELFEETGVLLGCAAPGDLIELRRGLMDGTVPFTDVLARAGATPRLEELEPAGRLITPPFAPIRFDTTFFVAVLPEGQAADVWPGELSQGDWWQPADAVAAWDRGELLLSPPTVTILEELIGKPVDRWAATLRQALAAVQGRRVPPIWFSPGVLMVPLDCRGLPPTRYTNAFVVGTGPRYLFDPGPDDPEEQEVLLEAIERHSIDAIVLTHHHPDHVGAAARLARLRQVPVLAHPDAAARLTDKVAVDGFIHDGDVLELGRLRLQALLTPGHAIGHLAFYEPTFRLLFAADLVSTLSSVIIDPEDGDLTDYLASVERARALPVRLLLPAHGPPTTRAAQLFEQTLAHRAKREEQLLAALAAGKRTPRELALELYRGSPEDVLRLAEIQVQAGLIKLGREGRLS